MLLAGVYDRTSAARLGCTFSSLALLGGLVLPIFSGNKEASASELLFQKWSLRPVCALWDRQAGEVIARRVNESHGVADLRQLGDAMFRVRRARRSCDIGWVQAACQDYSAVMRNIPGISAEWQGATTVCATILTEEVASHDRATWQIAPE
jgi:hypothetical protein